MIITCPSCATHHNFLNDEFVADSSIIKCTSCNHSWLESRAVEITDIVHNKDCIDADYIDHDTAHRSSSLPAIPQMPNTEYEAARIAKAIKQAEESRLKAASKRRATMRGWLALAACICAPFVVAGAFPQTVVQALPGSIVVYDKIGMDVNIHGFTFANITHQYLMANNVRILAIRGEIINVSGQEKSVPSIRFSLRDKTLKNVYKWQLNGVSKRPLQAGAATTFLTRIASPPKNADDFQIRFALPGEFVKTASHESHSAKWSQN